MGEECLEDNAGAVHKVLPEAPAVVGTLAVSPSPLPNQLLLERREAVVTFLLVPRPARNKKVGQSFISAVKVCVLLLRFRIIGKLDKF